MTAAMRIGLDIRMIDYSGIGTTIRGLLDHFSPEQLSQLVLFGAPGEKNPPACPVVAAPYPVYGFRQHWGYAHLLNRQKLDLFHMPHYDIPWGYDGPLVVTVHDLIHLLFPQFSTKPFTRFYATRMLKRVAKKARIVIADSNNTKNDLMAFSKEFESKTRVIYPAVDPYYRRVEQEAVGGVLRRYGLASGYLLYIGNLRPSKNTPGLLKAYEMLRKKMTEAPPLVLAGKNSYPDFERKGFPNGVRYLGVVPREDLASLYSGASLFLFPSFYEGFGLPPLEAMACGTPVLTSNRGSLPEICGPAADYVDPTDPEALANSARRLLESPSQRDELRRRGFENVKRFRWADYAGAVWKVYEEAARDGRGS